MATADTTASPTTDTARPTSRPELLAPAGDRTCLIAAIENGADAVYFGLQTHNARARASNFHLDELPEVMALLHRRGVRGYVTLNTLIFPSELEGAEALIRRVAEAGADALIVQDLGLCRLIRAITPDLEIHASTQMSITSVEGVRLAKELGCSRVILARELSVREIAKIREESPLPVEVFVHGALCVAYSGQCLTSEALGGRSANRGECAQACRMPYEVVCDGEVVDLGNVQYLLSPQDLAAFDLVPKLVEIGVASLKIEGRLKAPEYVANITRSYRKAIDGALGGGAAEFSPAEVHDMEMSFSRGFSHGFLDGNDHKVLVRGDYAKKRGVFLGRVASVSGSRVRLELAAPVKPGDGVVFDADASASVPEQGGRVYEVLRAGHARRPATSAESDGLSAGPALLAFGRRDIDLGRVVPGQRIWKTDDPALSKRLRATFEGPAHRRVDLDVSVRAVSGEPLALEGRTSTGFVARVAAEAPLAVAESRPAFEDEIRTQVDRLGDTVYRLRALEATISGGPLVPRSLLNALRRELVSRLDAMADAAPARQLAEGPVLPVLRGALRTGHPDSPPLPPGEGRGEGRDEGDAREEPSPSAARHRFAVESGRDAGDPREEPSPGRSAATLSRGERDRNHAPLEEAPISPGAASLSALCRTTEQATSAVSAGVRTIYLDFQDIKQYKPALAAIRAASSEAQVFLATPRIEKPGEAPIFRYLARQGADGLLIRNAGGLYFCAERGVPFVADFSLNAANELTVEFLKARGALRVTASYDLSFDQLDDLIRGTPPHWLEVVVHQHMPMFHMEFCAFSAHLANGKPDPECGRPCDRHSVELRDRVGVQHPLKADVGCRNTLFNAVPQTTAEYLPRLISGGIDHLRVEFLDNDPASVARILGLYREAIAGRRDAKNLWRELKATNQYGVTRGALAVL